MTAAAGQTASRIEGFAAVVPAGGAGTRLWPLSRAGAPKFLHDLTGSGRSLLQATWDRLVPLAGEDRVLLVTGRSHAAAVRAALPGLRGENLLLEPSARDSMAAIGLAAAVLERREGPEAVLGSFAADHVITDDDAFGDAVRQAVATARTGEVVTIGITPTGPATQFGYVRGAEPLAVEGAAADHVLAFTRGDGAERVLVAVALRTAALGANGWGDTRILADEPLPVAALFADGTVAVQPLAEVRVPA